MFSSSAFTGISKISLNIQTELIKYMLLVFSICVAITCF